MKHAHKIKVTVTPKQKIRKIYTERNISMVSY